MITQARLQELFDYDELFGHFKRKIKVNYKHEVGYLVGSRSSNGYLTVKVDGMQYQLHRLVWLYHYNTLPEYIDHINGDKYDNRLSNLRECTRAQNRHNMPAYKNNQSGVKGVFWMESMQAYRCQIKVNLKRHLKTFRVTKLRTKEEAFEQAKLWVELMRQVLHKDFANNS